MNHIRTLVHAPSGLHRLLLTFATALLLIAGLLAMHTLTGTLTSGHADTPQRPPKPPMPRLPLTWAAPSRPGACSRTPSGQAPRLRAAL